MEDLVESLARGNVTEVKVLLASVALALAVYQLVLIAVGYGKVRPPFLDAGPATRAHRASGDAIVVLVVVTAVMCLSYFGLEGEKALHVGVSIALLCVLARSRCSWCAAGAPRGGSCPIWASPCSCCWRSPG